MGFDVFDANRYDREILRPLRGTHGQLPPGDLLARYAVDPDMDAAELTAHLAEIRAWWERRAQAPDFRAEVCKLLMQHDDELRATAGPAMEDPAWWREQARLSPATRPHAADDPPAAATEPTTTEEDEPDWRLDARRQFWTALATIDRPPTVVVPTAEAPRRTPPAAPAAKESAVRLEVRPTAADGDRCRVEVSWPAEAGEVIVRYSPEPPPFVTGDVVPPGRARQWGRELTGTPVRRDGRLVLSATVPTGYHVYLPFEPAGDHLRAGRPAGRGIARQVQRLKVDRHGTGARVSWVWPSDSTIVAEVAWGDLGAEPAARRQVTRDQYTTGNGFPIPDARFGVLVSVRAVTEIGGAPAYSPAVVATLGPAAASLTYALQRRRRLGGAGELVVTLTTDRDCDGLEVDVVVSTGEFVPTDPGEGRVHARIGPLRTTRGVPVIQVSPWPDLPRRDRPGWIRCFVRVPAAMSAVDPPTDHMRIT